MLGTENHVRCKKGTIVPVTHLKEKATSRWPFLLYYIPIFKRKRVNLPRQKHYKDENIQIHSESLEQYRLHTARIVLHGSSRRSSQ